MKIASRLLPLLAAVLLFMGAAGALAQEPIGEVPPQEEPSEGEEAQPAEGAAAEGEGAAVEGEAAAAARPSNAAYMKPLGRLSSILGSMHFLRQLCGDPEAGVWRQKMGELIEAQQPNEADRRILVASFNSGYRAFESTYRTCTPAAEVAMRRYLAEGSVLSREISARYGN